MTQAHKTIGNTVKVKDKCFKKDSPWYPYYQNYQEHFFEVIDNPYPGHVLIRCTTGLKDNKDPQKPLEICLHDDELQTLSEKENKLIKKFKA